MTEGRGERRVHQTMDITFDSKVQVETCDLLDKTEKNEKVKVAQNENVKIQENNYQSKWTKQNEHNKAWILANPDRAREINKKKGEKYRLNHPEREKKRKQTYYAVNLCKYQAYRAINADKLNAYFKQYNREKRGCVVCKNWSVGWQTGMKKYDNHCFRCFKEKFPSDQRTQNRARAELLVREYINIKWADFVHDHSIETAHCACSHRRRVDHRKLVGNTLLCVETDERAHQGYDMDDEEARYHDIMMAWGGKLLFLRINPDGKGPPIEKRLEQLGTAIEVHLKRIEAGENITMLEVWHLYYPPGTPDYYDESAVPGWLETWQRVQVEAGRAEPVAVVDGLCGGTCDTGSACAQCTSASVECGDPEGCVLGEPISICAEDVCEASENESDIDEYAWSSSRPLKRPLAFLEPAARVEHETEDYDEDNPYKIDIDWVPVRAVPVMTKMSKE